MDIESEIMHLKRRVGDLEGAISVLTDQLSKVHPDLQAHSLATKTLFDEVEEMFGKMVSRIDVLNTQVWSLRDDLPELVTSALSRSARRDE